MLVTRHPQHPRRPIAGNRWPSGHTSPVAERWTVFDEVDADLVELETGWPNLLTDRGAA